MAALSCFCGYHPDFNDTSKISRNYWGLGGPMDHQPPQEPPPPHLNEHLHRRTQQEEEEEEEDGQFDPAAAAFPAAAAPDDETFDAAALLELEALNEYFSAASPPSATHGYGGSTGSSLHHVFSDGPTASPLLAPSFPSPDLSSVSSSSFNYPQQQQHQQVPGQLIPPVPPATVAHAHLDGQPPHSKRAKKSSGGVGDYYNYHQQPLAGSTHILGGTSVDGSGWFVDTSLPVSVTTGFHTTTTLPSPFFPPTDYLFPPTQHQPQPAPPPPLTLHSLPPLPLPTGPTIADGATEGASSETADTGTGGATASCAKTSLSAQSAAARQRRKRISDKTRELGRLIPGGNKMNTAEMFQAAHGYVKFLQAQIGVLQVGNQQQQQQGSSSNQETQQPGPEEEDDDDDDSENQQEDQRLRSLLLTSTAVQERLSRAEKCIIPTRLLQDLAADSDISSHPSISRDLGRLLMEHQKAAAGDNKDDQQEQKQKKGPPSPMADN